jgi:hypothetical protein
MTNTGAQSRGQALTALDLPQGIAPEHQAGMILGYDGRAIYPGGQARLSMVRAQIALRSQILHAVLGEAARDGEVDSTVATLALGTWRKISSKVPGALAVPEVSITENRHVILSWLTGNVLLDAEFAPDAPIEFFRRDRATGEVWGVDLEPGQDLPEELLRKFNEHRAVT